jgi:type IV secretory pathway VirB10-like protein
MAPEQIVNFADACTQSDLYAVGLILFECLTRKRAVTGRNSLEICTAQVQNPSTCPPTSKKVTSARSSTKPAPKPPKPATKPPPTCSPTSPLSTSPNSLAGPSSSRPVPSPTTPSASDDAAKIARQTMLIAVISVLLVVGLVCAVLFL